MCTAIYYQTKEHYFGRNLDLEYSYHETVTITPREYPFIFRKVKALDKHYAMIGMAYVVEDYPLYYDAVNEKGLGMAGLLFAGNAYYKEEIEGRDNVSPFEFIPWILGQCASVKEAKVLLSRINLVNIPYSKELPLTPLHWILADKENCIVVEAVEEGMKIYDNPTGVLTNNPPFEYQMMNWQQYKNLSVENPKDCIWKTDAANFASVGMGAIGLPGDLSSASRFVRAAFHKKHAVAGENEMESVNQFFHLLGSVEMPRGSVKTQTGLYDITVYSACCNMEKGIYYYTTYDNRQIIGIDMYAENLDGKSVIGYELHVENVLYVQNAQK